MRSADRATRTPARDGERAWGPRRSADSAAGTVARLRLGAQQPQHLLGRGLRLLAELVEQPPRQLVVVLRVPVVGIALERTAELLRGAAEHSEARLRILLVARLHEQRAASPEVHGRN